MPRFLLAMLAAAGFIAQVWYWLYIVIGFFVLMSALLAIVVAGYDASWLDDLTGDGTGAVTQGGEWVEIGELLGRTPKGAWGHARCAARLAGSDTSIRVRKSGSASACLPISKSRMPRWLTLLKDDS